VPATNGHAGEPEPERDGIEVGMSELVLDFATADPVMRRRCCGPDRPAGFILPGTPWTGTTNRHLEPAD